MGPASSKVKPFWQGASLLRVQGDSRGASASRVPPIASETVGASRACVVDPHSPLVRHDT